MFLEKWSKPRVRTACGAPLSSHSTTPRDASTQPPTTVSGVAMLRVTVSVSGGSEPIALTAYKANLTGY